MPEKGKGRVSNVYDDVKVPCPDAKMADKLCLGGPCYYLWSNGQDTTMMTTFVLSHIVPNIRKRVPDSTVIVLNKRGCSGRFVYRVLMMCLIFCVPMFSWSLRLRWAIRCLW
jgi:hypothetical protein